MTTRPLLLAHRGDHCQAPENSLAAIRAAAAAVTAGALDGVEFDVRASRDRVAVVLHDATLARVQGRPERAADLAADDLAALGVPALADVVAACPAGAFLDVELKEDLGEVALSPLLAARGLPDGSLDRAVVSAFEAPTLTTVRRLAPAVACWLNVELLAADVIALAVDVGCAGVSADWRAIEPRAAERVRRAGLQLAAWTVTRRLTLDRLARLGIVAACVEGAALPG